MGLDWGWSEWSDEGCGKNGSKMSLVRPIDGRLVVLLQEQTCYVRWCQGA